MTRAAKIDKRNDMPKISKPITAPLIRETMKAIPAGGKRTYAASDIGNFANVRCAASKLNAIDTAYKYAVTTDDNGVTMTISKSPKTN